MASPPPDSGPKGSRTRRALLIACLVMLLFCVWYFQFASQYLNSLAESELRRDHFDEAIGWLEWSDALLDGNPRTRFLRARLFRKVGNSDSFLSELDKFVDRGGVRELAKRELVLARAAAGGASEHLDELGGYLVDQIGDEDEVCAAFVNGFLIRNEYNQAFALIETWKQSYPQDPRPHYVNGRLQDHLSNWSAAEKEYRDALARQPDHFASAYSLARLLLENNHAQEAIQLFEVCQQMKYPAAALIGLAKCHRKLGDIERARQVLDDVLKIPLNDRTLSYSRLGEEVHGDPAMAEAGSLELFAGNYELALKYLDQAYRADPRDLDVRYARAMALRQAGRLEESLKEMQATNQAREELAKADRIMDTLDPLKPEVDKRIQVGEIYLQHGSLETAEFWIKSALAHDPANTDAGRLQEQLTRIRQKSASTSPLEHQ